MTTFVVRRSSTAACWAARARTRPPTLHHPGQVDQVCRREDLADLVAADNPLGPEQAAARSGCDVPVSTTWRGSDGSPPRPQSIQVRIGSSRAGAVDLALYTTLYTTASVDGVPA